MPIKPERKLYLDLRKSLEKHRKNVHIVRIENLVGQGVPDTHITYFATSFWLELKVSDAKKPPLSKYQIAWHMQHADAGGHSWILQRTQKHERMKLYVGSGVRNIPAWVPVMELPVPASRSHQGNGTSRSRCKKSVFEELLDFIKERQNKYLIPHNAD